MQRIPVILLLLFFSGTLRSQQSKFIIDPEAGYHQAREFYQRGQYSLAYSLFKDLQLSLGESDRSNHSIKYQQVNYYTIVCALKEGEKTAIARARDFIQSEDNLSRIEQMRFHMGEFYFFRREYGRAIELYEEVTPENLTNDEISALKYHLGFSYFTLEKYDRAKPEFDAIRQIKSDPHYEDANYFYGFIAFNQKKYKDALSAFRIVEDLPQYRKVVPYHIAVIYFNQGDKEKAFNYAESKLKEGGQLYEKELRHLVGHGYFMNKQYDKAIVYLESASAGQEKRNRLDIYELAYCYYMTDNLGRAIEGFKQLSGKEDSLAQHAMYLLGDAYLKTNQRALARNAFLFCSSNSSNDSQREVSMYLYAKLSFELGFADAALADFQKFLATYPNSVYAEDAREMLVNVLANTNNYKEALVQLEAIRKPSDQVKKIYPRILYGRATESINDGMLVTAYDLLSRAESYREQNTLLPFIYFWKGEIAYRINRTDEAIRYYQDYLKSNITKGEVSVPHARYNLGYCYLRKENHKLALSYFEQIAVTPRAGSSPLEQDIYLRTADCHYMLKEYKKASSMYEKVLSLSWPAGDYATFQNAMIEGVSSSRNKIRLLSDLIRKYPASSLLQEANMEIANSHLANENFTEAIPFLLQVIKDPVSALKPQAYLRLGIANYNTGKNNEALSAYTKLIQLYPDASETEEALENARFIYVEEGRSTEYVQFLRNMGKQVSASQEELLSYQEAEIQFNNGNFNVAAKKFEEYLSRFPEGTRTLEALYYKSEIYYNQKDWTRALTGYELLAERVPNKFGEKAILLSARLNFFEFKNYEKAREYFINLKSYATSQENKLEAMRGLLRSQFQLQQWPEASDNAKELLEQAGIGTDDKIIANLVLARSFQSNKNYPEAITYYRNVSSLSKAAYGAEALYSVAYCYFVQGRMDDAEKAAFETINKAGSYEEWVIRAYILLGDVYVQQKDYFNAKATYQSVIDNAKVEALRLEAEKKLMQVVEEEKK